jgi:uncharacterized protein (TIGR04255 family)
MGKKMTNAPVYYALAQVKFNAVLAMDQYISTIQENFRKAGYPDFEKAFMAAINMNLGGGQGQVVPAFQPQARYHFLNEGRTAGFVLEQSSISFQTTSYDTFEPFLTACVSGLKILHNAAELDYSERAGMRFLDAVCPKADENVGQYLTPSLLGLMDQLVPHELVHSISETRTKLEKTTMVSRAIVFRQTTEGAAFPPEFGSVPVHLKEKFRKVTGLYAVLDTDCWFEDREKFDVEGLAKRLLSLHDETRRSFELMVTPHARKVWE